MTQRGLIEKAFELSRDYPDYEIHVLAASEELLIDCAWTGHKLSKVELGWWREHDEYIVTDPDEMRDILEEDYGREFTEDEARAQMSPAILIHTRAG